MKVMAFLDSLTLTKTLPCLAEPGKIIVIAQPSRNLDGALPLVAAVAPNIISFNPGAGTLTLRRAPRPLLIYRVHRPCLLRATFQSTHPTVV
jgi:ArsR family metal-binding transcriptional regulator